MTRLGVALLVIAVAGCATGRPPAPPPEPQPCAVLPAELLGAGELPDGLPANPAEAIVALYRAWREARDALGLLARQGSRVR